MNQPTPGPWEAHFHDPFDPAKPFYTIRDRRNCYVALVDQLDAATYQDGQQEANARLIAAAPEMYEVLREIEDVLRKMMQTMRIEKRTEAMNYLKGGMELAQATIKKAGGHVRL